ncbi:MAG: hypothetical protein ABIJ09_13285 [Pseudomonadota bacterium]
MLQMAASFLLRALSAAPGLAVELERTPAPMSLDEAWAWVRAKLRRMEGQDALLERLRG